jgi:salicylate hydroxylase
VARSRTVLIAGAGIAGLTAAHAIARKGFRVVILEQAERLEETGAGIQLSPNATRVIESLGLLDRIFALAAAPEAIRVMTSTGRELARVPLGRVAEFVYRAPYLTIHRKDLQAVLLDAVRSNPDIVLHLGHRVQDFAAHTNGVTAHVSVGKETTDQHGIALLGADGLWSAVRMRLGDREPPRFRQRTAWRATVPAHGLAPEWREPLVSLWLGPNAHFVHYPVGSNTAVNLVAIVRDDWQGSGWSEAGQRDDLLRRFSDWAAPVKNLLAAPEIWLKWALHDRLPLRRWGRDAVTLIGDAAHPVLPFLAQGAALAIEDAYVAAECLAATPDDSAAALRRYEGQRTARAARVQRAAALNSRVYHMGHVGAAARNLAIRLMGGEGLMRRYDWVYDWRP